MHFCLRSWRALFLLVIGIVVLIAGTAHNIAVAGSGLPQPAVAAHSPIVPSFTVTDYVLPSKQPIGIARTTGRTFWFAEYANNRIKQLDQYGHERYFSLVNANSGPLQIVANSQDILWFTEYTGNRIGRFTSSDPSVITEYPIPTPNSGLSNLTCDNDGCWFTERDANKIGYITASGTITEYPLPHPGSQPTGITVGINEVVFTEESGNRIGFLSLTNGNTIAELTLPNPNSGPHDIVFDQSFNGFRFTEMTGNRIGALTASHVLTEYPVPTLNSSPAGIGHDAGGRYCFTEFTANNFACLYSNGTIAEFALPTAGSGPIGVAYDSTAGLFAITESSADKIAEFDVYTHQFTEYVSHTPLVQITTGADSTLWFTEGSSPKLGRLTSTGQLTQLNLPPRITTRDIVAGADGNLWFTAYKDKIGRITPTGVVTQFPLPTPDSDPFDIAAGPDGNIWFTESRGYIGRITPLGVLTEFALPAGSSANDLTTGPDNALWFTDAVSGQIGRISLTGTFSEIAIPATNAQPSAIVTGTDGNLWFGDYAGPYIWRMTPTGVFTSFVLDASHTVLQMALGSDGAIWFSENGPSSNQLGRISINGDLVEYPLAASNTSLTGITSGPDGALWILDNGLNRIARVAMAALTPTPGPALSATPTPGPAGSPTAVPSATMTVCPVPFTDVPVGSTFYSNVNCLVCRGIVGGYSDAAHCPGGTPCFQVGANVTRGQMSKFVAGAAGYGDTIPANRQTFTDVPPGSTFWLFVERAYAHGVIGGYTDTGHCPGGVPCFQPAAPVTRGQTAKFVALAGGYSDAIPATQQTFADVPPSDVFWLSIERVYTHGVVGGYTCGNPEPCPGLYFRPATAVTRGQTAKFISNAFFPNCQVPLAP